ncbi:MAG: Lysophospholipase, alpha-beta hydrolase superfamily [Chloroflexi bacterium AL-W]|nr:Lysophospholipase, alpha-beta hydrolase superfamily [Chloroflexi bacterium AL-N1]NOK68358.1 Lysophospholipase, alpha-beta hydrolase superfamily [Chloroflexi bacterium AL-N10]NOK74004.1 Lysophospholipase, alpha-beta hydrolase superfamily [Chloroflexi bacterium AL-N5]NOK82972.1 Lysophospholipase, alpha-beta hydrolase superfamily [Chloroflexi bacterium AL-W]NOK90494.1 Lysophospholipase, alpha-beta hydrolase superfamily [Chloroflexi bacterium AL-N15]
MSELYVRVTGDVAAPAIVFLHGGGLSGRMWQPQTERLTEFYCLAPDLPEHVHSAAAEIARLIRERVPGAQAHIVGLSIGAVVGLELLRTNPKLVRRAILSGTTPKLGRGLVKMAKLTNGPLLKLLTPRQLAKLTLKSQNIPPAYHAIFADDFQKLNADFINNVYSATATAQLPQNPVPPTLVVVGEKESGMSKKYARTISSSVQGVEGRLVKGVGHTWNLEAPLLFNDTIRAWLAARPLPPALQTFT